MIQKRKIKERIKRMILLFLIIVGAVFVIHTCKMLMPEWLYYTIFSIVVVWGLWTMTDESEDIDDRREVK